jgi:DNA-binding LacI/PurR family transcriptional regulator
MARARLQDVAEVAGVSMKTVSNVVRGYVHVSPATRAKVQRAIDELSYRPNETGRSLATGRTGLLALAFSDISIPYYSELARCVSTLARERGYRVLLEQTDGTLDAERAIVSTSEAGLVDGVLFQPSVLGSSEISRHRGDVPVILLGEAQAPLSVDHVMIDNVAAARRVTTHLAELGAKRIAFLGHERSGLSPTSRVRLAGYQEGLETEGLPVDTGLLIPTDAVSSISAFEAVTAALAGGLRFDGLVCRDDLAAIGALRALAEAGIRVPDDVVVTGWDDVAMASFTQPGLTTVRPDLTALAGRALDMLEERIAGFDELGRHVLVDFEVVHRGSAPALPAAV